MAFANLFPVMSNNGPVVLNPGTAGPFPFPYTLAGGGINTGNGSFLGNNTDQVNTFVAHGLGVVPTYVNVMTALQTGSGANWFAEAGQWQAADSSNFYVSFYIPVSFLFSNAYWYYFNWVAMS